MRYYIYLLFLIPTFTTLSYPSSESHQPVMNTVVPFCIDPSKTSEKTTKIQDRIDLLVNFYNFIFIDNKPVGGFYVAEISKFDYNKMNELCLPNSQLKAWSEELKQNIVLKITSQNSDHFTFSKPLTGFQCIDSCRKAYNYFSLYKSIVGLDDIVIKKWISTVGDIFTINVTSLNEGLLTESSNERSQLILNKSAFNTTYTSLPDGIPTPFTPLRLIIRAVVNEAYSTLGHPLTEAELIKKTNHYLPLLGHPRRDRDF